MIVKVLLFVYDFCEFRDVRNVMHFFLYFMPCNAFCDSSIVFDINDFRDCRFFAYL